MNLGIPLKEPTRDGLWVIPSFPAEHQQVLFQHDACLLLFHKVHFSCVITVNDTLIGELQAEEAIL